jgi:hypothetical protein
VPMHGSACPVGYHHLPVSISGGVRACGPGTAGTLSPAQEATVHVTSSIARAAGFSYKRTLQCPAPRPRFSHRTGGHLLCGTVTVALAVAVLPEASVAA